MFKEYFNLATVPFYWKDLEPEDGKPRYDKNSYKIYRRPAPDLCMDYCEQNGIMPKLHCLVYNSWTPEWAAALPSAELKKRYEKRFQEIAERYSGRMFEFEVINETLIQGISVPLCDERGIVEWAFDLARKYFPNEKLVINEADPFPCIGRNTPSSVSPYVDRYFLQLENLLLKGVSIDRIGVQNHMFVGVSAHTPEEYEKLQPGMTYAEIRDIVGGDGILVYESDLSFSFAWPGEYYYDYDHGYLEVDFNKQNKNSTFDDSVVSYSIEENGILRGEESYETYRFMKDFEYEKLDTVIVSKEKYKKLEEGMNYEQVCELFGGPGKLYESKTIQASYGQYTYTTYKWKAKYDGMDSAVDVIFDDDIIKDIYEWEGEHID